MPKKRSLNSRTYHYLAALARYAIDRRHGNPQEQSVYTQYLTPAMRDQFARLVQVIEEDLRSFEKP